MMIDDPAEHLADIVSLCAKVCVNHEIGRVHACDLVQLRDNINLLRSHVAKHGYKTVPGLVKDDETCATRASVTGSKGEDGRTQE